MRGLLIIEIALAAYWVALDASGMASILKKLLILVVGPASVMRWVRLYRANGDTDPLPKGGGTPSMISADEIAGLLDNLGDPTANELTAKFNRGRRGC